MADRGDYTPIARVLRNGPDFQRLSSTARHVFLDLKIAFGPCGIEVCYPDALIVELTHTTGYSTEHVRAALDELEAADWIARELNLLWIVQQLEFHPNMSPGNAKHRGGVRNHIRGLPRVALVRRFIERYAGFFVDVEGPCNGYPTAQDSLSNGYRITKTKTNTETETENETETKSSTTTRAQENAGAGFVDRFVEPRHRDAYVGHIRAAQNPIGLNHEIALLAEGGERPSSGTQAAFGWEVVGEALHHLSVNGGRPTPRALRTFCEGVVLGGSPALASGSDRPSSALQDRAAQVWRLYSAAGLVRDGMPRQEVQRIGRKFVEDGLYPDYASFLAEYIAVEPARLAGAQTDHWAIARIVERLTDVHIVTGAEMVA